LDLFSERGYGATTARSIASRAGVNEVTLFRHFGSKGGLLQSLIEREAAVTMGPVEHRINPTGDLASDLTGLGALISRGMAGREKYMRLVLTARDRHPVLWDRASQMPTGALALLREYFSKASARGLLRRELDPDFAAVAFFSFFFSAPMSLTLLGKDVFAASDESRIRMYVDLFVGGVSRDGGADDRR
jgi:AcrR family transcriptional regulator